MDRNNRKILIVFIAIIVFYIFFVNLKKSINYFPKFIDIDSLDFRNLLNNIYFRGIWEGYSSNNYFNNNNGKIKFNIKIKNYRLYQNFKAIDKLITEANFLFLDPEYFDGNVIIIDTILKRNNTNEKNSLTFINRKKSAIYQLYNTGTKKIKICDINIKIDFNKKIIFKNKIDLKILSRINNALNIKVYNKTCGINLSTKLRFDKNSYIHEYYYIIFILIISLMNLNSSLKIIKNLSSDPNESKSMNIITLIITCCIDLFLCIFHMILSIENDNFIKGKYLYLTPSFLYFIIFSLVDLNILFLIWKNNNIDLFYNNINEFKRRINVFHLKINFICLVFIVWFIKFYWSPYIILFISFILYPQIYQYCKNGMVFDIDYNYVINFCSFKLIILIYFRLFKNNLLMIKPYYFLMITSIFILIISIWIIYNQSYFGPKFFLPRFLNKNKYDYFSINSIKKINIIKKVGDTKVENNEVSFNLIIN